MTVDIILPAYNGERWIGEAIESVIAQTYTDWILTIVDDVSTDGTVELVQTYRDKYPEKIRIVKLEENLRAAGARMRAIGETEGESIAFLDQDDRWSPRKLERQIDRLAGEREVDMVHTDVCHIGAGGEPLSGGADGENARRAGIAYDRLSPRDLARRLFVDNSIRLVSALIRRTAFEDVGGFNVSLFGGEEWEFWVRFASTHTMAHVAEPLVERRVHGGNVSLASRGIRSVGLLEAYSLTLERFPELSDLAGLRHPPLLERGTVSFLESGDWTRARDCAKKLLGYRPFSLRALAFLSLSVLGPLGKSLLLGSRGVRRGGDS